MSKFNSAYFKRNTYQFEIKTKSSQKEQKKNIKSEKNNTDKHNNISDSDFNKLMEENNFLKKNDVKLADYISKIKDSEIANKLLEENLMGNDLVTIIESENISGSQLLKGILNKYNDPNNYFWSDSNQYGNALQFLLKENPKEQLLCLLLIQNHTYSLGFPKVNFKDKSVYFINIIFQTLFTNDIIDESTYWKWQDILVDIVDIDENTKKMICIQTTEFFNILKMTFTEEDYENDNAEIKKDKDDKIVQHQNNKEKLANEYNEESKDELDEYKVPEEQDYYVSDDDEDFNLNDL